MRGNRTGPLAAFTVSVLVLAGLLVGLAFLARGPTSPIWRLVGLVVVAAVPYLSALLAARRLPDLVGTGWAVVALSLALRAILVPAPPVFSDDVYRYVWDGRVLGSGINPYRFAPDAPDLAPYRNADWHGINHKSLKTIYPPLGEIGFAAIAWIAPRPAAFKLASACADAGVVLLLILIAGGRLTPPLAVDQGRAARAGWIGLVYGINPLACVETGMSGHLEPFAIGLTLLALLCLRDRRPYLASALLGCGAGVKLLPLLLLPVVARRRSAAWGVFFLTGAALYLPFFLDGGAPFDTLDSFARRWEGNAGLFALGKSASEHAIAALFGVDRPDAVIRVPLFDPVARALSSTFFSLHKDSVYDPAAPGAFALQDLALAVAKIAALVALAGVVFVAVRRRLDPVTAALWILGGFVLLTPIMHPWYLLWVLPLAAARGVWPFYLFGAALPLAYLPLDGWWERGVWDAPGWVPWLEYGVLAIAFAVFGFARGRGATFAGVLSRRGNNFFNAVADSLSKIVR